MSQNRASHPPDVITFHTHRWTVCTTRPRHPCKPASSTAGPPSVYGGATASINRDVGAYILARPERGQHDKPSTSEQTDRPRTRNNSPLIPPALSMTWVARKGLSHISAAPSRALDSFLRSAAQSQTDLTDSAPRRHCPLGTHLVNPWCTQGPERSQKRVFSTCFCI